MSTRDVVELDLELVDELIRREEEALEPKHRRSIEYQKEAEAHLPAGVSSSWQVSPPWPVYLSRGKGSRV